MLLIRKALGMKSDVELTAYNKNGHPQTRVAVLRSVKPEDYCLSSNPSLGFLVLFGETALTLTFDPPVWKTKVFVSSLSE